jgi:hypothetical protein
MSEGAGDSEDKEERSEESSSADIFADDLLVFC